MTAKERVWEIIIPDNRYESLRYQHVRVKLKGGRRVRLILHRDSDLLIPPGCDVHLEADQIENVEVLEGKNFTAQDLERLRRIENLRKVPLREEDRYRYQQMVDIILKDGSREEGYLKGGCLLLPSFDGFSDGRVDIRFRFGLEDIADIRRAWPKRFEHFWFEVRMACTIIWLPLINLTVWLLERLEDRLASFDPERRPGKPAAKPASRLSCAERKEFGKVEARIVKAEAALAAAEEALLDPAVASDVAALQERRKTADAARAELDALRARWEELESRLL